MASSNGNVFDDYINKFGMAEEDENMGKLLQRLEESEKRQKKLEKQLAAAGVAIAEDIDYDDEIFLYKTQMTEEELLQNLEESKERERKLEKQLAAAGISIAEDIPYDVCLKKIAEISKRMGEIGSSHVVHPDKDEQDRLREEYFKLEQEMEKYSNPLVLTDEYVAEQQRKEKEWDEENAADNLEALKKLRRHMPVDVRNMSEAQLTNEPSPNGQFLPAGTAKKFKRTNVLQIIRRDPDDLARMHPSTLESMRTTGLTLTERRALYEHVRGIGSIWEAGRAEEMTERKWTWFVMMKDNFKENLASYKRHVAQYGPPGAHPYATRANPNEGCPLLGKQCPLKADRFVDYDGDYGWTDEAVYEGSSVTKKLDVVDADARAKAEALELMKKKKAISERANALKKHYKGKRLQVLKANGSCESMDEIMDRMELGMEKCIGNILDLGDDKSKLTDDVKKKEAANFNDALNDCKLSIYDFCGRAGIRYSNNEQKHENPDPRSSTECLLAEEVRETFEIFANFIAHRMKTTDIVDTNIRKSSDDLTNLLNDLHERNIKTLAVLGVEKGDRSRPIKTVESITKEYVEVFLYKEGMRSKDVPKNVKRVKIDSDVRKIGERAFYGREELYEVDFSEASSLKEIGKGAFFRCKSLLEVKLSSSVNKIEGGAFGECEKMREVDFSEATSLKEIGKVAFYKCIALSEVEIPSCVKMIKRGAFKECENLTNVKMVEGLEGIGEGAFSYCPCLLEAEIPSTVERIEKEVFKNCWDLAKVKMAEGLKFVGEQSFYFCEALLEVDVPASVTFVGTRAFADAKRVTSKFGNNVALGIRLRAIYASQTQAQTYPKKYLESIPLEKLVTAYSHKPIKTQELQDPTNQDELDLLRSIKNEYIKVITSLNASTKNPLLSFQEQHGWVQFVTNYEDYVNEKESKVLIEFLNTVGKETVQALADAKDRYGRVAVKSAISSIREVFRERLLFQGRYDIAPGPPIHKSATCIVVRAEDNGMKKYYEESFQRFNLEIFDLKLFGAALKLMHVVSDEESPLVEELIKDYFERVDIDCSGKVSKDEFVQFCSAQFGNEVVLKFMRNKDQFERELDGRKTATTGNKNVDRLKDDLLSKYVVSVIRSYDKESIDTTTLQDTVGPYLSEEEQPEQYCHVLVMPYGDRNLDTIFRSERPELTKVRDMLQDVGNALLHLHEKRNLVHGDLKMLNIVRVQGRLSLIDLDASAKIGSAYAGAKFSSGVLPPEMIHRLKDVSDESSEASELKEYYKNEDEIEQVKRAPRYSTYPPKGYVVKSYLSKHDGTARADGLRYELEKAHPSLDVWSFGVLLYAMCTGEQSLFSVSRDDDIVDGDSLGKLFDWGTDSLLSDRNLEQKVSDPYARDLLLKILTKDPKKRPKMREVLDHAFFKTEKQTNVAVENLQKLTKDVHATAKENQKIIKREFAKIHESLRMVIQKQVVMQNMLKDIIKGGKCPKYLIILPKKKGGKTGVLSWVLEKSNVKLWMYEECDARICFVCPISLQPVIGPDGEAIGYDVKLPKEWVKKYGPAILIGLKMLQVGFAVGRGFGLPFPSLGDANEKVVETLGAASDLLSSMQDIAMEGLGLEEDDDLADLLVDKISETTKEAMSADISDDGRKKIQESYEGIGKLVEDEKFERCGLVEAYCDADGTREFVHPDLKALYEEKGQAVLETMGPEMIDKAAAAARAGARNSNQSEVSKTDYTATDVAGEAPPPARAPNSIEPINNIESLLDERFSQMSQQISKVEQSLSIRDGMATGVTSTARTSGDNFSEENFSKISKQIREVQQSLSIRDTIQLSESTTRSGSSIVHEGRFRIQSQRFPRRWQERQFFLYDGGYIKHFPVSGQWLRPSSGRWQAKKTENGDGVELVSGGKVACILRLSEKANDSSKSPDQNIEEWVAMLNSPSTVTQLTDRSGDRPSKASAIKRIDSTGEIIST